MPAVLGLGWWKVLMSWPPLEILFQPRLPVGTCVCLPTPALIRFPPLVCFGCQPNAVSYSPESASAAGSSTEADGTTVGLRDQKGQEHREASTATAAPGWLLHRLARRWGTSLQWHRHWSPWVGTCLFCRAMGGRRHVRDILRCCGLRAVVASTHGKGQKCLLGLVLCSRQARAAPVRSPGSIRWVCQATSANQPLAGAAQEGTSLGLLYYHRLSAVADDCDNRRRITVIKETIFTKLLKVLFSIYITNAISKY